MNRDDFEAFMKRIRQPDVLQWAVTQHLDSVWVCELVTNVTFFVNTIVQHPIGFVGTVLPDYIKRNMAIINKLG